MDPTKPLNISSQQHHGSDTPKHEKFKLVEINSYLTCHLCKGYLIDATTISECLHSFCRSCIIKFLQENCYCPVCEVIINKAKPCLKLDKTLQDIVYKLVPQLFTNEMHRRKQFYHFRPELARKVSPEERGEDTERTIFNPQDAISLSIEYVSDDSTPGAIPSLPLLSSTNNNTKNNNNNNNVRLNDVKEEKNNKNLSSLNLNNNNNNDCENVNNNHSDNPMKRYLQCPGMCRIEVLKKFVRNKYNVDTNLFHIDILYKRVPLPDHYTLIDIGYIYSWKRNEPMKFFFRITDINKVSERFDYFDSSSYYRNNNENNTKTTTATMSPLSNAISSNDHHHKETTMSALKQYNHQSTTKQMKNRKPSQKQQQQAAAIVAAKNKEKNNVIKSSTPPPSMPSSATTTINNVKKTSESDDKKLTTTTTNNSVKEISNVGSDNKKKVMMLIKEKQKKNDSVINTIANKNSVNEVIVRKMEKLSTSSSASSMLKQSDNKINGENRLIIDNNCQNDKKVQNKCSDGVLWPQSLKIERKTDEKLIPSSASVNKQLQTSTPTLATKMSLVKKPNNLSKTIESVVSNQENGKSALKFKTSELKNENDDDDLDPKSKFFKSIELTAKSSIVTPEKKKMGGETLKNLKLPPTVMTNQQQQQGEKRKSEVMFLKRADGEQTNKKLKLSSLNGATTTTPINKKPMRIIVRSKDNLKSASCSEKQSTVRQIMLNLNQNVSNVSKIVVDSSASPPNGIVAPPLAISTPTPSNKTPPPPPPSTNDLQSLIDNCKINIPSSLSITLNEGGGEGCGPQPPSIPPVKNFIEILKLPENASTMTTDKMQVSPNGVKPQSFQKIFEESVKKSATPTTTSETKTNANNKRSILEIALKLQKKTKIAEKQKNKDDKKDKTKEVQNKTVSPKTSDLDDLGKQTANLHSTSLGLNYTVSVNKSPETSCAQPPTITTTTTNFKTINNNQVNKKQQISPTSSSSSAVSTPKLSPSMKKQSPEAVNSQLLLEKYNIQNLAQLSASFPSALAAAAAAAAAASSSPSSTNHLNAIQHAMFLKHIEHQNWLNHQSSLRQYEKYLQNLNASSSNTAQNAIISTSTANIIKDN